MKKLFLFAILFVAGFTTSLSAQDRVKETKDFLRANWCDIVWEEDEIMEQDERVSLRQAVMAGETYFAVVVTNDGEVIDLDIAVYDEYGDLMAEDDDIDRAAIVEFTPDYSQTVTVKVHNYESVNELGLGLYTCTILIARLDD